MNTMPDLSATAEILKEQYLELCEVVHKKNPHFWEALVEEEASYPPPYYSPGSQEEADLAVYQCLPVWQESEDAILMVDADTAGHACVY